MNGRLLFLIGFALFSFTIGSLLGQSQVPVLSTIITGVLSVLGVLAGILFSSKKNAGFKFTDAIDYSLAGLTLIIFSVFFLLGIYLGIQYRISSLEQLKEQKQFVWENKANKPESFEEEIDWINIQENLKNIGYSESRISKLYNSLYDSLKDKSGQSIILTQLNRALQNLNGIKPYAPLWDPYVPNAMQLPDQFIPGAILRFNNKIKTQDSVH